MRLSQIGRGKRAERVASFPYSNEAGESVEIPIVVIPLSVAEETEVLAFAREYAKKRGVNSPTEVDPMYSIGAQVKTLHLAVRDSEGQAGSRAPFFASTDEIEECIERETLTYLYVICDEWQDACSPSVRKMNDGQLIAAIDKLGSGGTDADRFFDSLSPITRRILLLSMARQLRNSFAQTSSPSGETLPVGTSE